MHLKNLKKQRDFLQLIVASWLIMRCCLYIRAYTGVLLTCARVRWRKSRTFFRLSKCKYILKKKIDVTLWRLTSLCEHPLMVDVLDFSLPFHLILAIFLYTRRQDVGLVSLKTGIRYIVFNAMFFISKGKFM